jgi:hypothetical protein
MRKLDSLHPVANIALRYGDLFIRLLDTKLMRLIKIKFIVSLTTSCFGVLVILRRFCDSLTNYVLKCKNV